MLTKLRASSTQKTIQIVFFAQQLLAYQLSLSGTGSVVTQMIRHLVVAVVKTPLSDLKLRHFFSNKHWAQPEYFALQAFGYFWHERWGFLSIG